MAFSAPKSLALTISIGVHAVFLVALPKPLEVGRNLPTLVFPVRVRVLGPEAVRQDPANESELKVRADADIPSPIFQGAATPEGKLENDEKKYVASSERYFPARELDSRPSVIDPPDLDAEKSSPLASGEAVLQIFVNENGSVDRIEVEHSTLPDRMLANLRAQSDRLHFSPGMKNGVKVKSVLRYRIVLEKEVKVRSIGGSHGGGQ